MFSKRQYNDITGRKQASNIIAYQIRQSFKPGEISPELANKIGYELGMSFTKGKHAFIVATHIDKAHIHNHIIFNSTTIDCKKKFRDFLGSGRAIAKISDRICLENNLSIIEKPNPDKPEPKRCKNVPVSCII
jgi:type IV secretory pathway VirD2 relaxase